MTPWVEPEPLLSPSLKPNPCYRFSSSGLHRLSWTYSGIHGRGTSRLELHPLHICKPTSERKENFACVPLLLTKRTSTSLTLPLVEGASCLLSSLCFLFTPYMPCSHTLHKQNSLRGRATDIYGCQEELGILQLVVTSTGNDHGKRESKVTVNWHSLMEVFLDIPVYKAPVPPLSLVRMKHPTNSQGWVYSSIERWDRHKLN